MSKIHTVKLPIQRNGIRYGIGEKIELEDRETEKLKDSLVLPKPKPVEVIPESIPEPLVPFEESIDDVLSEPEIVIITQEIEAETQEEIPKATKRARARS